MLLKVDSASCFGDWVGSLHNLVHESVTEHIEASIESAVGNISEVDKISHDLFEIAGVGSVAEVSILLRDKAVGFMRKLAFDDVLEAVFVERLCALDGYFEFFLI